MRVLGCGIALAVLSLSSAALAGPLAVAEPLQTFELAPGEARVPTSLPATQQRPLTSEPDGAVLIERLIIEGTRGDGLNAAAQIYRAFSLLGLSPEVHCQHQPLAAARPDAPYRSTIQLHFQEQLSPKQQQDVRQLLASLTRRTPAVERLP